MGSQVLANLRDHRLLFFKDSQDPDNRSMTVPDRHGPGMHRERVSRLVLQVDLRIDHHAVTQGLIGGVACAAKWTDLPVMARVDGSVAEMAQDRVTHVSGNLLRAVIPEDNAMLPVGYEQTGLQVVENGPQQLRIFEVEHWHVLGRRSAENRRTVSGLEGLSRLPKARGHAGRWNLRGVSCAAEFRLPI